MATMGARRALAFLVTKSLSSASSCSSSVMSRSRFALPLFNTPFLDNLAPSPVKILARSKTSVSGYSPLNDRAPNWNNRPPKETILLDGCDYEHWLIVMDIPDPKPPESEMIDAYVKALASVVGSEEEAKKKIYSVCTTIYTGFGALISEELSYKLKELPSIVWVLPDSYLDVPNKDYGGDLYVDGKVIHRPQYTSPRQKQVTRIRPRYDRRRETMQVERRVPNARQSWPQAQPPPQQQSLGQSSQGQQGWFGSPPGQQTRGQAPSGQPSEAQQFGQELPPGQPPSYNH